MLCKRTIANKSEALCDSFTHEQLFFELGAPGNYPTPRTKEGASNWRAGGNPTPTANPTTKFIGQLEVLRWRAVAEELPTMFILTGNSPWDPLTRSGAYHTWASLPAGSSGQQPGKWRHLDMGQSSPLLRRMSLRQQGPWWPKCSRICSSSRIWYRMDILPSSSEIVWVRRRQLSHPGGGVSGAMNYDEVRWNLKLMNSHAWPRGRGGCGKLRSKKQGNWKMYV